MNCSWIRILKSEDNKQVCEECKKLIGKPTGDEMNVYLEIDITKDEFYHCAMDDELINCTGMN